MKIDMNKKYRTRDGREVRIYATDGGAPNAIHGAVNSSGTWESHTWRVNGMFRFLGQSESKLDLIEVKEKIVRWVNVFRHNEPLVTGPYESKSSADFYCDKRKADRIACVRIEFEEGEGLQ